MKEIINPKNAMNAFFDRTPDLVCVAKKDGFFQDVNAAVINKLGYSRKELFERPIASFIHADDRERTSKERAALLQGKQLLNFQNRYLTKKGEVVWLQWTSVYDAEQQIVFAIAKDVTEKKNTELELEAKYKMLKQLNQHFKSSMEEDRRYFSAKLHEELAQIACVVKMDMDWIQSRETDLTDDARKRLQHAIAATELLINSMQKISYTTNPGLLLDVGLNEALAWHCNEFSRLHGITISFTSTLTESSLPKEARLDFFRICQEVLTDIKTNSSARSVTINIQESKSGIVAAISDDGKRKTQKDALSGSLLSVEQRVIAINGTMAIHLQPGQGSQTIIAINKQVRSS
jgi:PAS domain S-box-containing protein